MYNLYKCLKNLNKLNKLHPVLDIDGSSIMSSGNFAVVFKMEDNQTESYML